MIADAELQRLARHHGLVAPPDEDGNWPDDLAPETIGSILAAIGLEADADDAGYAIPPAPLKLPTQAARRCFVPAWFGTERAWGVALQLYELRSDANWGIGDFRDLARFVEIAAKAGADFVGLNPLHALFLSEPDRCSPFSPSSRLFLNPLYIAVDAVEGFEPDTSDLAIISTLRAAGHVNYGSVAALKLRVLRQIWESGRPDSDPALQSFLRAGGEALHRHSLFEALSAHMVAEGRSAGWLDWPVDLQDPDGDAVRDFEAAHESDVRFHAWLQFIADRQLKDAADAARHAGMRIGLYLDMAVGEAPDGSAAWSYRRDYIDGARVGAPPDMFTADGQDWGLTALSPLRLRATNADLLRATYQAAMRHAGAIRLDHAMGIWQIFLVPDGKTPKDGAYVRQPIQAILSLLAELSETHRTIVIGEDLGIVPPGFRDLMQDARILAYKVLFFEKTDDAFTPIADYAPMALACLATHDLPTLKGWLRGLDIEMRARFGLVSAAQAEEHRVERATERTALADLLHLSPSDVSSGAGSEAYLKIVSAAHGAIAKAPSALAVVRFADLSGETSPTNVPGTTDAYPNWRMRCSLTLEDFADDPVFEAVAAAMNAGRRA
jgi:4-alpha-glucanotransferase